MSRAFRTIRLTLEVELIDLPYYLEDDMQMYVCDWISQRLSYMGHTQVQVAVKEKQDE